MLLGKKSLRTEKQRMSHEIVFLNFKVSEMYVRLVKKKQCFAFFMFKKHLIWLNAHLFAVEKMHYFLLTKFVLTHGTKHS
jgi:hypothetical protein